MPDFSDPSLRNYRPSTRITDPEFRLYNAILDGLIWTGHADQAVEWYVHHTSREPGRMFNATAGGVDQYGIDRMYVNWRRLLARCLRDGEARDTEHLHRLGVGFLKTLGRHYGWLAARRDDPRMPADDDSGKAAGDATETSTDDAAGRERDRVPLFARVDAAAAAVTIVDPAAGLERADLAAVVRRGCRMVGRAAVRVLQIVRRYEFERGTAHGADVHLARFARLAVVGGRERVVGFRSWRETPSTVRPSDRVVREVRAIHRHARERVRVAAQLLGYPVPPGW